MSAFVSQSIATPTIIREGNVLTLNWPESEPRECLVARAVLAEIVAEQNELRALKARRCDGCANWPTRGSTQGHRMTRADVLRNAWTEYHAGRITLADLLRTITQWRPRA